MSDPYATDPARTLEPVHAEKEEEVEQGRWTFRLVVFLRIMAGSETTDDARPVVTVPEA